MFRTNKPAAQPRTLRTIAEDKGSTPASRAGTDAAPVQPQYSEVPPAVGPDTNPAAAANPSPFANLKGGRE